MTEWNAPGYARIAQLQQAMAAEALALLNLKGTERVLDVGCGNGKVTAQIAARLPEGTVVGIDPSSEMIAFASKQFSPAALSNLRFEVGDARSLPFADEFDLVVSFNALHWVPDQDNALRSIRRTMKANSTAQLRLVPAGSRKSLENVIEESRSSPRWAAAFRDFHDPYLHWTPEQYAAASERHHFRIQNTRTADKAWDFKSREAFVAFGMVTFVEWTKRLPEEEKPAFVNDVLDRYQQVAATQPGEENVFKFYQMDVTLSAC
jgi:trans-aconitate 2-methyltransferase